MKIKKVMLGCFAFIAISCLGSCGDHKHINHVKNRLTPGAIKFVVVP